MTKCILFVCTENSARSQIAEGFFNFYKKDERYLGVSAGTNPSVSIKPYAVEVMSEVGIDITKQSPKILSEKMARNSYKIYTMGCISGCPLTPPEKTEDWALEDPSGKSIDEFRSVRNNIEKKVKELIFKLE